jgi:hypothetical protein
MSKVARSQRKVPKMSAADIDKSLHELDAWVRHERPGRLTWQVLEEFAGFTRQALSANEAIAHRFGEAKHANRPEKQRVNKPRKTVDQQVVELNRKIKELEATINRYDVRFARWIHNAMLQGYKVDLLEEPMLPPARAHVRVVGRSSRGSH